MHEADHQREQTVARRCGGRGSARSSARSASGASAETKSLPSCPGRTSDATMPVSSYARPPITRRGPAHAERAQRSAYMVTPASTMCSEEAEVHRRVDRQDPAQPRGGIEDVAVHARRCTAVRRTDTGSTRESGRWRGTSRRRRAGSRSRRRTGRRPAASVPRSMGQHSVSAASRNTASGDERRAARLERSVGVGLRVRHALSPGLRRGTGPRPRTRSCVSSTREATASAVAAPIPSGPCSMRMNRPSRTPSPPGANSARKPAR